MAITMRLSKLNSSKEVQNKIPPNSARPNTYMEMRDSFTIDFILESCRTSIKSLPKEAQEDIEELMLMVSSCCTYWCLTRFKHICRT